MNIYTRVIPGLPYSIKGFVIPCEDGYCIYINNDIPKEVQVETYWHEMEHIRSDHLQDDIDVGEIELELA